MLASMNTPIQLALLATLCVASVASAGHAVAGPVGPAPAPAPSPASVAALPVAPAQPQPAPMSPSEQASPATAAPARPLAPPQALVPLPSVLDFTRGGGFGLAIGVGVEYEAAYDGSDEYEVEFSPAGAIQWRTGNHMLFFEYPELGWRGVFSQRWLVQAGLRYEGGLEPSDSDDGALDGIKERDSHLTGFAEVRWALDSQWRNWIAGRILAGESEFGVLGVLAAGHRFGHRLDGMGTEVYAFVTFGDSAFLNKDFGVTAEDALASGLAETTLDGGYRSAGLQLVHRQWIARRLQLIGQAGVELYNSEIADSPIARDDYEFEVSLTLVWQF